MDKTKKMEAELKEIFVGLDVHKKNWVVSIVSELVQRVKMKQFPVFVLMPAVNSRFFNLYVSL